MNKIIKEVLLILQHPDDWHVSSDYRSGRTEPDYYLVHNEITSLKVSDRWSRNHVLHTSNGWEKLNFISLIRIRWAASGTWTRIQNKDQIEKDAKVKKIYEKIEESLKEYGSDRLLHKL